MADYTVTIDTVFTGIPTTKLQAGDNLKFKLAGTRTEATVEVLSLTGQWTTLCTLSQNHSTQLVPIGDHGVGDFSYKIRANQAAQPAGHHRHHGHPAHHEPKDPMTGNVKAGGGGQGG